MKPVLLILTLLLPASGPAADQPEAPASSQSSAAKDSAPIVLEPMVVYGDTKLAFGFGLKVTRIDNPRVVLEMLVDRVKVGSDAERKGPRGDCRCESPLIR